MLYDAYFIFRRSKHRFILTVTIYYTFQKFRLLFQILKKSTLSIIFSAKRRRKERAPLWCKYEKYTNKRCLNFDNSCFPKYQKLADSGNSGTTSRCIDVLWIINLCSLIKNYLKIFLCKTEKNVTIVKITLDVHQ